MPTLVGEASLEVAGLAAQGNRVYAVSSGSLVVLQLGESVVEPRLEFVAQDGVLLLDWSSAGSGAWVLQHCSDLSDAQGWETLPGSETTTQWQPGTEAGQSYFRLKSISP